jgi:hypothetical protein
MRARSFLQAPGRSLAMPPSTTDFPTSTSSATQIGLESCLATEAQPATSQWSPPAERLTTNLSLGKPGSDLPLLPGLPNFTKVQLSLIWTKRNKKAVPVIRTACAFLRFLFQVLQVLRVPLPKLSVVVITIPVLAIRDSLEHLRVSLHRVSLHHDLACHLRVDRAVVRIRSRFGKCE